MCTSCVLSCSVERWILSRKTSLKLNINRCQLYVLAKEEREGVEVFDTAKVAFLNKLFVFEGFRRSFQNPEKLGAKNMFFDRPWSIIDLQLCV